MVYVLMAEGFEELELIAPVDMLRRAGVQIVLVSIDHPLVMSTRKISVQADIILDDVDLNKAEAIFLPGGSLGVDNLSHSEKVCEIITQAAERGIIIAAICAAPSLLGTLGLLKGRDFTCYPGCEKCKKGFEGHYTSSAVEWDGKFLTGKGAGVALEFGAAFVAVLKGRVAAEKVCQAMQTNPVVYVPVLSKWS